jgi:hypothetical protein
MACRELSEAAQGRIGGFPEGMFDGTGNILGHDGDVLVGSREDSRSEGDILGRDGPRVEATAQALDLNHAEGTVRLAGQEDSTTATMQKFSNFIENGDTSITIAARKAMDWAVIEDMANSARRVRCVDSRRRFSTCGSFQQF